MAAAALLGGKSILAADDTAPDVDRAMRAYFSARFRAIDSGDPGDRRAVLDLIATDNKALRDFVDRDIAHLSVDVRSYGPIVGIQHEIQVSGRHGNTFSVKELTRHSWANPTPAGFVQSDDPRLAMDLRPVIQSGVGYDHTVTLGREDGRLRVNADAFRGLGWDSPDVKRGSGHAKIPGGPSVLFPHAMMHPGSPHGGGGKLARPLATGYFWDQAVNYCYTYWSNYNASYHDYNPYGGDCTSFISQALANAGWTAGNRADPNAYWYDAAVAPLSEGWAWYNNNPQRTWILANARGWSTGGTPQLLARGDIVYYDWNVPDGTLDHTAMVTTLPVSTGRRLVSCHTPNLDQKDWETWPDTPYRPFNTVNIALFSNF